MPDDVTPKEHDVNARKYFLKPALAYVSNGLSTEVSVIDIRRARKVLDIPVGNRPQGIDISPNGRYAYVANLNDNTLSVIKTLDHRVIDTIDLNAGGFVSDSPRGVKISPDGRFVYVTNLESGNVSVVDTHRRQVVAEIPLGTGVVPDQIDITPDGQFAYVALPSKDEVAVIDLKINLPVAFVSVDENPHGIDIAANRPLALVTNQNSSNLIAINTGLAEASTFPIFIGKSPFGIVFNSRATTAYVTNTGDDNVSVVDIFTHTEQLTIPVGNRPLGIDITSDDKFLVVANEGDNTVSIINTNINQVIDTVPVITPFFVRILSP